ncbi:hypothetical protein FIBSPDRAFT_979107 [Athelia psychrophila]|uniref:Uncharacterized protein n=1 Tax=Athelia psychrophila TaxID=1759441 RepID=A0A166DSR9_9AGAM|nr:hypothetical protein FIBSPDRAFT_979107 [Fibularhizoctonia sp. CBS 109695]
MHVHGGTRAAKCVGAALGSAAWVGWRKRRAQLDRRCGASDAGSAAARAAGYGPRLLALRKWGQRECERSGWAGPHPLDVFTSAASTGAAGAASHKLLPPAKTRRHDPADPPHPTRRPTLTSRKIPEHILALMRYYVLLHRRYRNRRRAQPAPAAHISPELATYAHVPPATSNSRTCDSATCTTAICVCVLHEPVQLAFPRPTLHASSYVASHISIYYTLLQYPMYIIYWCIVFGTHTLASAPRVNLELRVLSHLISYPIW